MAKVIFLTELLLTASDSWESVTELRTTASGSKFQLMI